MSPLLAHAGCSRTTTPRHPCTGGLPRVWLTLLVWGLAPRRGCRHAQEVPCGVQA
jgi:hypothetical protein